MAEVIDFTVRKKQILAKVAFEPWERKFKAKFSYDTSLAELENRVINYFLPASKPVLYLLQNFVTRILYYSSSTSRGFYELDVQRQMLVVDVSIFLIDQFRFEAMYRLGWVEDFEIRHIPILELVLYFKTRYSLYQQITPDLSPSHPLYPEYLEASPLDQKGMIRRLVAILLRQNDKKP